MPARARGYIALLPLIILTHMIERFWTVETEEGLASSGRTLINTVIVAVAIALIVNLDAPVNAFALVFFRTGNLRATRIGAYLFSFAIRKRLGFVYSRSVVIRSVTRAIA